MRNSNEETPFMVQLGGKVIFGTQRTKLLVQIIIFFKTRGDEFTLAFLSTEFADKAVNRLF